MKVPVSASSPLSSSFPHGSAGSGGGALENESSPKKIVLTKLSRRTKLLAYGTRTPKRY